jgi:hypothetical protein
MDTREPSAPLQAQPPGPRFHSKRPASAAAATPMGGRAPRASVARQPAFRRHLLALSAAVALLLVIVAAIPPARASTLPPTTLEDLARASRVVTLGTVARTQVLDHGPAGQPGIHTRVTLAVEEAIAGHASTELTFWAHGGRLGNQMRRVVGQAHFAPQEDVATFLFANDDGDLWPTGMARGKWHVVEGAAGERLAAPSVSLRGHVPSAPEAPPHRHRLLTAPISGAEPTPQRPIPVHELIQRVRSARRGT